MYDVVTITKNGWCNMFIRQMYTEWFLKCFYNKNPKIPIIPDVKFTEIQLKNLNKSFKLIRSEQYEIF